MGADKSRKKYNFAYYFIKYAAPFDDYSQCMILVRHVEFVAMIICRRNYKSE